ncbi:MAG: hypothetical protein QNJ98_00295 [Planctomycetota bacterium]|nr:hypothetical protein [Planctomycetota bacterium]
MRLALIALVALILAAPAAEAGPRGGRKAGRAPARKRIFSPGSQVLKLPKTKPGGRPAGLLEHEGIYWLRR